MGASNSSLSNTKSKSKSKKSKGNQNSGASVEEVVVSNSSRTPAEEEDFGVHEESAQNPLPVSGKVTVTTAMADEPPVPKEPTTAAAGPAPIPKKTPKDFVFGKMIGEGSFSSVYLAKDVKSQKEYAIKVCDKKFIIQEKKAEHIRREKEVMTILSANKDPTAPFFVHLYATFQDPSRLYFVITLARGGELLRYLKRTPGKRFSSQVTQFYGGEILSALRHLHKLKIVHRDLKPENILLTDKGHILVSDFGSAKQLSSSPPPPDNDNPLPEDPPSSGGGRTRRNSFVGTAQYVSPEVLQGQYDQVGPAADLWAFGCVLFQLLTGSFPFRAETEYLIFRKILGLQYEFPSDLDISPESRDIVEKLLQIDIKSRLGASDGDGERYTSIQSHPFFAPIDIEVLHTLPAPLEQDVHDHIYGKMTIPEEYEPGFDPCVIARRVLNHQDEEEEEDEDLSEDVADATKLMDNVDIVGQ